jgi:hypothetical protein
MKPIGQLVNSLSILSIFEISFGANTAASYNLSINDLLTISENLLSKCFTARLGSLVFIPNPVPFLPKAIQELINESSADKPGRKLTETIVPFSMFEVSSKTKSTAPSLRSTFRNLPMTCAISLEDLFEI